jgi:hypothetical protein
MSTGALPADEVVGEDDGYTVGSIDDLESAPEA